MYYIYSYNINANQGQRKTKTSIRLRNTLTKKTFFVSTLTVREVFSLKRLIVSV